MGVCDVREPESVQLRERVCCGRIKHIDHLIKMTIVQH